MERANAILDPIAADYLDRPGVDIGGMFAQRGPPDPRQGVRVRELPGRARAQAAADRVDELDGEAGMQRMVMRERAMREWLTVPADAAERWAPLVAEAYAFVDEITP